MAKRTPIQRGLLFMIPFLMGLVLWVINELFNSAIAGTLSTMALVLLIVGGLGMLVCLVENAFR